ncbi:MAG: chorismate synthase [Candidatus Firestonebacteria bacterium RIFOXYA2_FULL_40_8]|nr:MAG: chorismate synthase [Candidatus Firestonebacteria bacterium RIFOXYA2_FULL_40_8]
MIRFLTAGESHGKALVTVLDGVPSGLALLVSNVNPELKRRQEGYGRGGRMAIENDTVEILSGVRNGKTTGAPITLLIANSDAKNWENKIVPPVTMPRPGHADLSGVLKYGLSDIRDVLERASARETAARVAAGAVCKALLKEFDINIFGYVTQIAGIYAKPFVSKNKDAVERSPLRTTDAKAEKLMIRAIEKAKKQGDSLGGVFEVRAVNVPPGIGSYTQWDKRLDARLAGGLMSLQAIKGVEIGLGFEAAKRTGSKVHDEIYYSKGSYFRKTNNCGGLEGGMSNGSDIVIRAAMKPIATLYKPLNSIDIISKKKVKATVERSDTCAVPAACVVGEAIVAYEIVNCFMEKFGGDTVLDMKTSLKAYLKRIKGR